MEDSLSFNILGNGQQQLCLNAFGHSVTMPFHKYGPAVRPYHLIHYILEGKGEFIVNETHYTLSAGKGFLIEPDHQTTYISDGEEPWTYIWVGFSGGDAKRIVSSLGLSQEQPIFRCENKEQLKTCVLGMIEHEHSNTEDTFYCLAMLYLFLSAVAGSDRGLSARQNSNLYVDQAIAYIRDHSTLFKQHTGLSPLRYIQQFRLTKAQHLLESTQLSVAAIAYSCGYQQPESLIKLFKQQYGVSPASYRKMILQESAAARKEIHSRKER